METTETRRLTVSEHFSFQPEFPERFDWSSIINGRHKELCEVIAEAIVLRRAEWANAGKEGQDPLIPGLQESLRLISERAVWRVMQIKEKVKPPDSESPLHTFAESLPRRASYPADPNKRQREVVRKIL